MITVVNFYIPRKPKTTQTTLNKMYEICDSFNCDVFYITALRNDMWQVKVALDPILQMTGVEFAKKILKSSSLEIGYSVGTFTKINK